MTWDTWHPGGPVSTDRPAVECGRRGRLYRVTGAGGPFIARCADHAPGLRPASARQAGYPCDALTWPEPPFELARVVGLTAAELRRLAPDRAGPGICVECRLMPAEPGLRYCADCAELAAMRVAAPFTAAPPARAEPRLPPRPVLLLAAAMVLFVLSVHTAAWWLVLPAVCCLLAADGPGRSR